MFENKYLKHKFGHKYTRVVKSRDGVKIYIVRIVRVEYGNDVKTSIGHLISFYSSV